MKVAPGPARAELVEHGWRTFLVKVRNEAGVTAPLRVVEPATRSACSRAARAASAWIRGRRRRSRPRDVADRWLDLEPFDKPPLAPHALGPARSSTASSSSTARDAGKREATLAVDVGQGSQDLGFRNDAPILFTVAAVGRRHAARPRRARQADDRRRS